MKKILFLIFFIVSIFVSSVAIACIDFSVGFSTEVFLTKPGVQYDVSKLSSVVDTKNKKIHFNSVEGLAYVSHYNDKVVVIVAEDSLDEPAEDESEYGQYSEKKIKGLDVTIQIPYKFKEGLPTIEPAVDIDQDIFDFAQAMKTELQWLLKVGVIQGLSQEDIDQIASLCTQYTSGIGGRAIYLEGQWMLSEKAQGLEGVFANSISKSIPQGGSCSGGPGPEEIMELVQ